MQNMPAHGHIPFPAISEVSAKAVLPSRWSNSRSSAADSETRCSVGTSKIGAHKREGERLMSAHSSFASFEMVDAGNSAALLLDHRSGKMLFSSDLNPRPLRVSTIKFARGLKLYNIRVAHAAAIRGLGGPLGLVIPEIAELFPDGEPSCRTKHTAPGVTTAFATRSRRRFARRSCGTTDSRCHDASGAWFLVNVGGPSLAAAADKPTRYASVL